ncbi:MAG: hypothetical protein AAGD25_32115 [Cyanobacteria bacterium P01_F01_bin.150]
MIGLPILLLGTFDLVNPEASTNDKEEAGAAIALFGLPSTAVGVWLLFSLRQQNQQDSKELQLEQEQLFLKLVQQHEGNLTVTTFALAAQISIEDAEQYLDTKARQLEANFEASDDGGIIYRFPV